MLARYKMYRGERPLDDPLPVGIRQDTRWRTRHVLGPTETLVKEFLAAPHQQAWSKYRRAYLELLEKRFAEDRTSFEKLAELARTNDLYIGCSCPTKLNPRFDQCHTFLALRFVKRKYPLLKVQFPAG
jgi:hypothetical protein